MDGGDLGRDLRGEACMHEYSRQLWMPKEECGGEGGHCPLPTHERHAEDAGAERFWMLLREDTRQHCVGFCFGPIYLSYLIASVFTSTERSRVSATNIYEYVSFEQILRTEYIYIYPRFWRKKKTKLRLSFVLFL